LHGQKTYAGLLEKSTTLELFIFPMIVGMDIAFYNIKEFKHTRILPGKGGEKWIQNQERLRNRRPGYHCGAI
jgi:hypothetical protein